MPPVVAAVASWAVGATLAITGSVTIAAAVGNAILGLGTLFGASGFFGALKAWAAVASLASLFIKQKQPKLADSGQAQQFRADPNAPRQFVFGEYGVAGTPVFGTTYNANQMLLYISALSDGGPIDSFREFRIDGTAVTLGAAPAGAFGAQAGMVTSGKYASEMFTQVRTGALPETRLLPYDAPTYVTAWTTAHKLSGVAHAAWALRYKPAVYTQGVPQPLWVIRGVKCYDPRLDSTYPGGSGAHRWNDESTHTWSRNPALVALWWLRGVWQGGTYTAGKRIGGVGMPWAMIDVPTFVTAANVCDTNGWTCCGIAASTDSKFGVLQDICAAMAGFVTPRSGKIAVVAGASQTSVMTLTDDLLAGPIRETTTRLFRDRFNRVVPYYADTAHDWKPVPAEAVTDAAYVAADGEEITRELPLTYVDNPTQARQIAMLALAATRENKGLTAVWKPIARKCKEGDFVTVTSGALNITAQVYRVKARTLLPDGSVSLELETDTAAKYATAMALTGTAPTASTVTRYDASANIAPGSGIWTVAAGSVASGSGTIPALIVTGAIDNPLAASVIVEYRPNGSSVWRQYSETGPATARVEITGIGTGNWDVAVSYRIAGTNFITPQRVTSNVAVSATLIAQTFVGQGALAVLGTVDAAHLAAAVGTNRILDSLFRYDATYWSHISGAGSVVQSTAEANGIRYRQSVGSGVTVGAAGYIEILTDTGDAKQFCPVQAGDRIEASVYIGRANTSAVTLYVYWYDEAATFKGLTTVQASSATSAGGGDISTYTRLAGFATAPTGARRAVLAVQATASTTAPTLRIARPFCGVATSAQTENSAWSPGVEVPAIPLNFGMGAGISRSVEFPVSSSATTTIAVAAHTVTLQAGSTLSLSSATITGLTAGTIYEVYWDTVAGAYVAVAPASAAGYRTSVARYLYVGTQSTQTGGGGYTSPPSPPPGYRGDYEP